MESLVVKCDGENCEQSKEIGSPQRIPDGWIKIQSLTLNGNTYIPDTPNRHKIFCGQSCFFQFISKILGGTNGRG